MSDTTAPAPTAPTAATETPKPQAPATPAPDAGQRDAADAPLGEAGLKALREERAARERLERELGPLKEQMDALRGVFGDKAAPGQDIVQTLQQQMQQMQHERLVDSVARRHGITDDGDVEFLRTANDEAAMTRLAARLKVTATPTPTSPAHDPSQASATLTPEAVDQAAYEAFFPSR